MTNNKLIKDTAKRKLRFTSAGARFQYYLLMALYRVAFTRAFYGHYARNLARLFPRSNAVWLHIDDGPGFRVSLDDAYWTRFALYRFPYEPEIDLILRASIGQISLFCDLGANKGFWTVRAAPLFQSVIAVEASTQTFDILKLNTDGLRNIRLHHAAINDQSGEQLTFVNTHLSHASARLLQDETASEKDQTESVSTIKVDDLIPAGMPALIKLDVEGAEVKAINGASRAINDGSVLIYEDHGSDHDCAPSAHLLTRSEISVYSIENGLKRVRTLEQIREIKTDTYKGYNFLAAQSNSPLLTHLVEHFANHE